ncbi:hypothetical protein QQ020_31500 [Fulvivirgaceae bacterium BMA12]|uniref:Uncharacterized protein n=1 Tax=Agaribacillus aureus TaxID=3051825 RepID=A0ABT8LFU1_9BACT|nr:hypothetical protein [Fulvivirgaceae bacterium BMA12]
MPQINLAASENAFRAIFDAYRDTINFSASNAGDFGPFSAAYSAGIRLEGGTVDLENSPDQVKISELDVVIDPLSLTLGIDIPSVCVGGFCIVPNPFGGCLVRLPRICLFEADPDISTTIDLGGLIESEISGAFDMKVSYFNNPDRAGLTDHQAHFAAKTNEWQLKLDPRWLDIDLIDISDTVGNILDSVIDNLVDGLLGGLPGWVKDAVRWILGGMADLIRGILDLADDVDEWLSNLLGTSLGLFDFIATWVADYFANREPVFSIEDPYPVIKAGSLIPVLIPIKNLSTDITDVELVVSADIG